jgi:transposase-like protein
MNPQGQFCPNMGCSARGQIGQGNIGIHSRKDRRYICRTCGQTFSESTGTAYYQVKKVETFTIAVKLVAHGCPVQAIVAAFEVDERTVAAWLRRAGTHCQTVHEQIIGKSHLDLGQVQADEIKVHTQRGTVWAASAMMVSTRLWLGGVVSVQRDLKLIRSLVALVVCVALCRPLVWAVDGLSSYVPAIREGFRSPLPTGRRGRPHLIPWPDIAIVQVVKRRAGVYLSIERRIVRGCSCVITDLLHRTQGTRTINTAYIERLNATFRQCLACLARRSRALLRAPDALQPALYLIGSVYNFCTCHDSLRLPLYVGRAGRRHWVHRTPALAAGLTDHRWSVEELLSFKIPPPPFVPPKRRGRPPKRVLMEVAA